MPEDSSFKLFGEPARLTTEHAASSYGQPVLVWQGEAYGLGDLLEDPETGVIVSALGAVRVLGRQWEATS